MFFLFCWNWGSQMREFILIYTNASMEEIIFVWEIYNHISKELTHFGGCYWLASLTLPVFVNFQDCWFKDPFVEGSLRIIRVLLTANYNYYYYYCQVSLIFQLHYCVFVFFQDHRKWHLWTPWQLQRLPVS